MTSKKVLTVTTGTAAKALGLSQQTIIRMCDNKQIENYKIPNSRVRRIYVDTLMEFAKDNGIRVDEDALAPQSVRDWEINP